MRFYFSLLVGKLFVFLSSRLGLGNGSTWPGHVSLKIDGDMIEKIFARNPATKVIIVAGTNGKTTTTSLLDHLLGKLGYRVFSNREGANLVNGVSSTLVKNSDMSGNLKADFAVLEVDEFSFPSLIKKVKPDVVIILNLFRDQLDRYGEVNTIGSRWFFALKNLPKESFLIINGDDPYLFFNGSEFKQKKVFFGVNKKLMELKDIPHDVDFIYCPSCQALLDYESLSYAHLGNYYCVHCGFHRTGIRDFYEEKIYYPLEGLYSVYNTNAVLSFARFYLKIDLKRASHIFRSFKPAFGRQEEIVFRSRKIFLLLSKNPAGFNQSLRTVNQILENRQANFLFVLNDRIPDGQDVSWIWDVDFAIVKNNIKSVYLAGDRVYDLAVRFKYENKKVLTYENLKLAVNDVINKTEKEDRLFIIPTYSAMLEVRKILLGKKFL